MKNTVPALEYAVQILKALADHPEDSSSLGLARQLGISQSTCYRILKTLQVADWITPDAQGGYRFSLGLLPFVKPLMGLERAVDGLAPFMKELSRATGLTVKCSVRQGLEQVTIARVESTKPLAVSSPVGARFPVVLGASGACLLSKLAPAALGTLIRHADQQALWGHESADDLRARLAACRRDGLSENIGRHPQGIDTISAPLTLAGEVYALTLVGLRGDFAGGKRATLRRALRAAVKAAARKLDDAP